MKLSLRRPVATVTSRRLRRSAELVGLIEKVKHAEFKVFVVTFNLAAFRNNNVAAGNKVRHFLDVFRWQSAY